MRDLVLSPDHAVFVDGALVPIRYLVNRESIAQETRGCVTDWHVELAAHDVILAEGMACKSFLDTGNRTSFENTDGPMALYPEFTPADFARADFARADFARAVWDAAGCAAIVMDPADLLLRARHTALLARAYRVARNTSAAPSPG